MFRSETDPAGTYRAAIMFNKGTETMLSAIRRPADPGPARVIQAASLFLLAACSFFLPLDARADVTVSHAATSVENPVRLTIRTAGRFFPRGGVRISCRVDGKLLARTMTGGDGFGFVTYVPDGPGLKEVTATAGDEQGKGLVLVTAEDDAAVLVEIEAALALPPLYMESRKGARDALEAISRSYKIIYVTRLLGEWAAQKWLHKEGFPESVVLAGGSRLPSRLAQKGITLRAAVGSPNLLSDATEIVPNRYAFEKTDRGTVVREWSEILESLEKGNHDPAGEDPPAL